MARRTSIHELKRRLMRAMARPGEYPDRIAREIRAHACACAWNRGRTIDGITADSDLAAGWDRGTVEAEIRGRMSVKGRR